MSTNLLNLLNLNLGFSTLKSLELEINAKFDEGNLMSFKKKTVLTGIWVKINQPAFLKNREPLEIGPPFPELAPTLKW